MHADAIIAKAWLMREIDAQPVVLVCDTQAIQDPAAHDVHGDLFQPPSRLGGQHQHHLRSIVFAKTCDERLGETLCGEILVLDIDAFARGSNGIQIQGPDLGDRLAVAKNRLGARYRDRDVGQAALDTCRPGDKSVCGGASILHPRERRQRSRASSPRRAAVSPSTSIIRS